MTTTKRPYSTAGKPRATVLGEADSIARAADQCQADLTAGLSHIATLEADFAELAAENHATRNEMQVWQLKVHALRTALADLLTAINAIPYNYIVISYLERIEPQMVRAGEVLEACGEGVLGVELEGRDAL